jgi:hypothetical protein
VAETIERTVRTGPKVDIRILVMPIDDAIRIRTGKRCANALERTAHSNVSSDHDAPDALPFTLSLDRFQIAARHCRAFKGEQIIIHKKSSIFAITSPGNSSCCFKGRALERGTAVDDLAALSWSRE